MVWPPKVRSRSWNPWIFRGFYLLLVSGRVSGCFLRFSPQIIHFNTVFHYFHHPFRGKNPPICWKHPYIFLRWYPQILMEALCFARPRLLKIVTSMLNRWGSNEKPEGGKPPFFAVSKLEPPIFVDNRVPSGGGEKYATTWQERVSIWVDQVVVSTIFFVEMGGSTN